MINNINHPLPLNTKIKADKPNCPCKGGGTSTTIGTISKIIQNQSGIWYYLSSGTTISSKWITQIYN